MKWMYILIGLIVLALILWLVFADGMPTASAPTGTSTAPLLDNATTTGTALPDTGGDNKG